MIDKARLEALRTKYEDAKETEVAPDRFRAPLNAVMGSAYRRPCRLPAYRPCSTSRIGPMPPTRRILPVSISPSSACRWISASPTAPGARFGPRAVRDVERIGPYDYAFEITPRALCNVADIGDVPMRSRYSLDQSIEDIAALL